MKAEAFNSTWAPVISLTSCVVLIGLTIAILFVVATEVPNPQTLAAAPYSYLPVRAAATSSETIEANLNRIDGVDLAVGDRVLFTHESDSQQNGIYVKTATGYKRSSDLSETKQISYGNRIYVYEGDAHAEAVFALCPTTANSTASRGASDGMTEGGIMFYNQSSSASSTTASKSAAAAVVAPALPTWILHWEKTFTSGGDSEVITVDGDAHWSYMIEVDGYQSGAGQIALILNKDVTATAYENIVTKQADLQCFTYARSDPYPSWSDFPSYMRIISASTPTNTFRHMTYGGGITLGFTENEGSLHSIVYLNGSAGREKIATGTFGTRETHGYGLPLGKSFSSPIGGYYQGTNKLTSMQVKTPKTFKGRVMIYRGNH